MRILSCVPEQRYTFQSKLDWIDETAKKHAPIDIFCLPQEYFGGIQAILFKDKTDQKIAYKRDEVLIPIQKLAKKFSMGIAVGFVVDDPELGERRERVYVVDPEKGPTGFFDKSMLPAYDHVDAKGLTMISPETDYRNRTRTADVKGAKVSVLFCWEVYSDYLWHAIAIAQPDFLLSPIKFGVCGWPQKAKVDGRSVVTGFGFGGDGGWIERLILGSKWQIAAPVFCSTNSWDLPCRARPLAGMIWPFGESTLWCPEKGTRGKIPEHVQVDEFDPLVSRFFRGNKFAYHEATGEWPPSIQREHTMMWKVRRMERQHAGLPATQTMETKPKRRSAAGKQPAFDL